MVAVATPGGVVATSAFSAKGFFWSTNAFDAAYTERVTDYYSEDQRGGAKCSSPGPRHYGGAGATFPHGQVVDILPNGSQDNSKNKKVADVSHHTFNLNGEYGTTFPVPP